MSGRSYRQRCALARALDAVGDRWSMLIVRNLLLGPQRWSELREGLPGIASNLLADRLRHLEDDGVLQHDGQVYALTEAGRELERALFALADWGERHRMGAVEDDAVRLRYLMTSMRRRLRPGSRRGRVRLVVDGEGYEVTLGPAPSVVQAQGGARPEGGVRTEGGPRPEGGAVDAELSCSFADLRALLWDGAQGQARAADDRVRLEGDPSWIDELVDRWRGAT